MSHPELREEAGRLEVRSPMRVGTRVALALLGLVPLIAPYELLLRTEWRDHLNLVFLFAAVISLGAMAVSAFFFFGAVAGMSSVMVFDAATARFSHVSAAPIVKRTVSVYPLAAVRGLDVGVREWSDGAPSYHLRVAMADGTAFRSGSSWSRDDIESLRRRVSGFLGRAGG